MKIHFASHLFGQTIAANDFPNEHASLLKVIGQAPVPLRLAEPFKKSGRPSTPKRQKKKLGGKERYALLPVDQVALNLHFSQHWRAEGWEEQPIAAGPPVVGLPDLGLRGDFVRNKVFVEVEFGNAASLYRDLFKFQVASRSGVGELGVLVVATDQMARFFDSGVATYEMAVNRLPYMRIGIQMPIWIIGLEPDDWPAIRARYEVMKSVAEANGLDCHSYEDWAKAPEDAVSPDRE